MDDASKPKMLRQLSDKGRALFMDALGTSSYSSTSSTGSSGLGTSASLPKTATTTTHYSPSLRAGSYSQFLTSPALQTFTSSTTSPLVGALSLDASSMPSGIMTFQPRLRTQVVVRWVVPSHTAHIALEVVCYEQELLQLQSGKTKILPEDTLVDKNSDSFIYRDAMRGIHASHSDLKLASQTILNSEYPIFIGQEELLKVILANGTVVTRFVPPT
jgi:hypothetical protein